MPVVTMTTFQLGVSGVASRSRFTTPTDERLPQDRLGDRPDARGSCRCPCRRRCRSPSPTRPAAADLRPVLPLEQRVEMQAERQLDRLARGARGGDDDDSALGMGSVAVGVGIGGKVVVAGGVHAGRRRRGPMLPQNPGCSCNSHTQCLSGPLERTNQIDLRHREAEQVDPQARRRR